MRAPEGLRRDDISAGGPAVWRNPSQAGAQEGQTAEIVYLDRREERPGRRSSFVSHAGRVSEAAGQEILFWCFA